MLICASFFGYSAAIAEEIEARGLSVGLYEDRPSIDNLTKLLIRVSPRLLNSKIEAYFDRLLEEAINKSIRKLVVIKGEAMTIGVIRKWRESLPGVEFILYFWDSYKNMPKGTEDKVIHFDRAYSFDPRDVKYDKRLTYRPLFYTADYFRLDGDDATKELDLLFIGTLHSDRFKVVKKISKNIHGRRFKYIFYVRSKMMFFFLRIFIFSLRKEPITSFVFEPLTKPEMLDLIKKTKCVLDIERSIQAGLTMRTIEMLGASKKLVTTNQFVAECEMYSHNNICLIDRNDPIISDTFFDVPWADYDEALLKEYSIGKWVDNVVLNRFTEA
jgi:hypothetical protein